MPTRKYKVQKRLLRSMTEWYVDKGTAPDGRGVLRHRKSSGECGYVCKVIDTENYYCYTCATEVPAPYIDVMCLGQLFIWNVHTENIGPNPR